MILLTSLGTLWPLTAVPRKLRVLYSIEESLTHYIGLQDSTCISLSSTVWFYEF